MSSKDKQGPPFVIATHPESKAYFREIATPKKMIREVRSNTSVACAECTKPAPDGVQLSQCAKCKICSYCSKECQRKHWPIHKLYCAKTKLPMQKFISNFTANPTFMCFLQIAAILTFGLDKKSPMLDTPLLAQCHVGIVPKITYLMGLATRSLSPSEIEQGSEGMLQVNSFNAASSDLLDRTRMEMWKNTKIQNAPLFPNRTVVVVDFHMRGSEQSITMGLVITDLALEMVRDGCGFRFESAVIPGFTKNMPLTVDGCLSFINKHIRADEHNQLLLRTHMTKEDIDEYQRRDEEPVKSEI